MATQMRTPRLRPVVRRLVPSVPQSGNGVRFTISLDKTHEGMYVFNSERTEVVNGHRVIIRVEREMCDTAADLIAACCETVQQLDRTFTE